MDYSDTPLLLSNGPVQNVYTSNILPSYVAVKSHQRGIKAKMDPQYKIGNTLARIRQFNKQSTSIILYVYQTKFRYHFLRTSGTEE